MKQIRIGAVISYAALAVNIAATIIYMPWMVSVIGKANYAMYTLANSFVNIFVMDFGLSSSVSKFIAQYRAEGDARKENEFMATVSKVYLILDCAIAAVLLVLFFFIERIYTGLTAEEIQTFRSLYLIVASYAVVSFPFMPLSGVMYAYEKLIETKLCELFQKLFSIVLVVAALLYRADVKFVVLANVVSALLTLAAKYVIVKGGTGIRVRLSLANMAMFREVVGFTVWIAVQALAQRCIFNLAPSILGIVATSEDIAVFSPATSIEGYFASVASAINGFFIMRITKYIVSDEKEQLYQLLLKVGRFQVLLLGMVYVVFLCVGGNFMRAWMGEDFWVAWPCAALVMLPDLLIFSEQVANTAAIANSLVKYQALGYVLMAAVCVLLSFPLSSAFGAVGASAAIAVAYLVLFVYNNVLYTRKMKLNMGRFLKECYGSLILPILAVGIAGFFLCNYLALPGGWIGVIIKAAIVTALYALTVFWALTGQEKAMIRGLFGRKR
nr:hypothetical protein [uncultured Acetatifactor sp.]